MKWTRTLATVLAASTMLALPVQAGWKTKVVTGIGIGVGAYMLGKAAAHAAESDVVSVPVARQPSAIAPISVPYPGAERLLERIGEIQEVVGIIQTLTEAEQIVDETVAVASQLYSQAGLEMACYHHRSYNQVKWAGGALTGFGEEARERYTQYANCCVSDGPRHSALSGLLALFADDDPLNDLRGLGNVVDTILDGVNAAYTEQAWGDMKEDIMSAAELQRSQINKVCQPLVSASFADWQQGTLPPMPALE